MAVELPPDPYLALGVPRDATPGAIKTSYRKLVLKFHPDKVQDETQKQAAADQFHKIQTAYEIVSDEGRRARYDAQCKLAELRKEVMEKQGGVGPRVEIRTTGYRMPTDSPGRAAFTARGPERERVHVEERRPYDADYFDRPRATSRKDYDYERSKRSSPKDDRDRVKVTRQDSKENERYRQKEKVKQTSRDTRRERDYKQAHVEIVSEESDSDTDERNRRSRKQEDDARRHYEQANRQRAEPERRTYSDDRTKKMFSDVSDARDYIERSRTTRQYSDERERERERRHSPPRQPSTKDKVGYFRRTEGGRPEMVRSSSGRPRTAGREAEEPFRKSARETQRSRRMSNDEDETPRRPPTLAQTKSAPEHIRLPGDPRRTTSLQTDFDRPEKDFQAPPIRRADSMPQQPTTRRTQKPSNLRQTEINENGLPTPSASPDSPTNPNADRYKYRTQYADDSEYATPDGYRTAQDNYRTEVREPTASSGRRMTRSPSPMKEDSRRTASARYPGVSPRPAMPQTRTTSYMYTPSGVQETATRPSLSRSESRQQQSLYGEIPTTRSPRVNRSKYSPPPEEVRYQREMRPEDVRYQTGYGSRRASEQRPSYSRTNSYSQPVY